MARPGAQSQAKRSRERDKKMKTEEKVRRRMEATAARKALSRGAAPADITG